MREFAERRKEARKTAMKFTPVYDLDQGKILGYLRDLTLQGTLVIGEKALEISFLYFFPLIIQECIEIYIVDLYNCILSQPVFLDTIKIIEL